MKINSKVKYGLRTMVEIARNPEGILQKEISIKQAISDIKTTHFTGRDGGR